MSKMKTRDLTGMYFGRWEAISQAEDMITPKGAHMPMWNCRCTCENRTEKVVNAYSLWRGDTTSCGCLSKEHENHHNTKYNEYKEMDDYYIGYDHNGKEFYFDKCDYEKVKARKWYIDEHGYARTFIGKEKVYLHRYIFSKESLDNMHVDHIITENRFDNRRSNLRIATEKQNSVNKKRRSDNSSGIVGVHQTRNGKWAAKIYRKWLGTFSSFNDAARTRIEAEIEMFGNYMYKADLKILDYLNNGGTLPPGDVDYIEKIRQGLIKA